MNDLTQDTVDHMRDMESSGRVDMGAYRGEDNHDDNVDKYGKPAKPDGLRGDGGPIREAPSLRIHSPAVRITEPAATA